MAFLSGVLGAQEGQVQRKKDDLATSQNNRDFAEKTREFDAGQAGEDKRNQAYVDSINAGVNYKNAQTDQLKLKIANLPAEQQRAAIESATKLGLIDAQTSEIWMSKIPQGIAKTAETQATTKKILTGDIPKLQADAAYQRHKIDYDTQMLSEKYAALDAAASKDARDLAQRLQIANMSNDGKLAVASMMVQSGLYKNDENNALKIALAQYQNSFKDYEQKSNPKTADPNNPTPAPQMDPTVAALLAGVLRNGQNGGANPSGGEVSSLLKFLAPFMKTPGGQASTNGGAPPMTPEEAQAKAYADEAAKAGKDKAKIADLVTKAAAAVKAGAPTPAVLAELKRQFDALPAAGAKPAAPSMPIGTGAPVIKGISPALLGR